MGRQGRERIARDFSPAAYTGLFAVFSARSPHRRISVRRAPNFRAHGNLFLCAQKNISVRTKISRLPNQCSDALLAGGRLLYRVLSSIQSAKASHAQLSDMPLRRDTQALRFIAHIPLIQRREKRPSHEEKSSSRSGFLLSTHVVLKTRHVNPNIHVRRY